MDRDALETYLNDHLAGSVVGLEIARRCASRADDPEFAASMTRIRDQIERDQEYLRVVMNVLGLHESLVKVAAAVAGAWASWARSTWFTDEPLGELEDLEALCIGVWGKRLLWGTLGRLAAQYPALDRAELDRLAAAADVQEKDLIKLRDDSVARVFAS